MRNLRKNDTRIHKHILTIKLIFCVIFGFHYVWEHTNSFYINTYVVLCNLADIELIISKSIYLYQQKCGSSNEQYTCTQLFDETSTSVHLIALLIICWFHTMSGITYTVTVFSILSNRSFLLEKKRNKEKYISD